MALWVVPLLTVAACGTGEGGTDHVGNPPARVTVTVGTDEHADSPAALMLGLFADEVSRRSDGLVQVDVTFSAAGSGAAWDQRVIEDVADGEFDLVVARAGAWQGVGVTSLDVLQLPRLVDTDAQANRLVADDETVERLLTGLEPIGFTGLGLFPEAPRYLMLLDGSHQFDRDALRGRTVRAPLNDTVFAVLRAAGMAPIDLSSADFLTEVSDGNVTMTEGQLARVALTSSTAGTSDAAVAANLPLYTKFLVLAARSDAIDSETLALLSDAALAVVVSFVEMRPNEADAAAAACRAGGRLVHVPADDLAAFMFDVQPVIEAFASGPDGNVLQMVRTAAGSAVSTSWACPQGPIVDTTEPTVPPGSAVPGGTELVLPTSRSDIVPTPGDLPDGVYRFTETLEALDATNAPSQDEPLIGEWLLRGGHAELRYFYLDGTPQAGEPPDVGGVYQVVDDLMIFATPPERAIPGTSGIYLLRWSLDGDTLTLTQMDDGRRDADFAVPWVRVGDAPTK